MPFTKKYFLLKYTGYVKAGIELKDISVKIQKDFIEVQLPKAKIFDTFINEKSIHVYNQSGNIFNPLKIEDYNKAIIAEKNKIEKDAIKDGILDIATEQAHLVLSLLLSDMNFKKIEIKSSEGILIKSNKD